MRRAFRHALVLIIVFALVASAAAWRQCTALQLAAAAAANVEHDHHNLKHRADVAGHDHHAMHHHKAADDPATPAADDHGCMKCCSMCIVANALLPAANTIVIFTVSAHVFFQGHKTRSGSTVAVDPGIPKRIV